MRPLFCCDGPPTAAWADGTLSRLLKQDGLPTCAAYQQGAVAPRSLRCWWRWQPK